MMKFLVLLPAAGILLGACNTQKSSMMEATPTPIAMEEKSMMESPLMSPMASGMQKGVMVGGAMMTPDRDIVANALNAKNVTTLVTAVQAAGLVATLQGQGPFTVFAPTNDAFAKLPAGTVETLVKPESKTALTNILTYHVVPGRFLAADLTDGKKLKSVQGQELTVSNKAGVVMIVDAKGGSSKVETADVISSNGVTHVVQSVLMPK